MNMHTPMLALGMLFSTVIVAQGTQLRGDNSPKDSDDGSWIGISGTVESTSTGSFVLDYGEGNINVMVDPEASQPHEFKANEAVTVYGIVDDGFFKKATILARTIYLDSQKTYACSTKGSAERVTSFAPSIYTGTLIHGRVHKVSGMKLMVDEGDQMMTVDATALKGKMTNAAGAPTVHEGDLVTVVGVMDTGFFTGKTLKATSMDIAH